MDLVKKKKNEGEIQKSSEYNNLMKQDSEKCAKDRDQTEFNLRKEGKFFWSRREKKKTRMAKYIEKVLHGYMENWDSSGQMDYLLKKKKV